MDLYTVRNNIMKGVPLQELNVRVCFYARVSTDKAEQIAKKSWTRFGPMIMEVLRFKVI